MQNKPLFPYMLLSLFFATFTGLTIKSVNMLDNFSINIYASKAKTLNIQTKQREGGREREDL